MTSGRFSWNHTGSLVSIKTSYKFKIIVRREMESFWFKISKDMSYSLPWLLSWSTDKRLSYWTAYVISGLAKFKIIIDQRVFYIWQDKEEWLLKLCHLVRGVGASSTPNKPPPLRISNIYLCWLLVPLNERVISRLRKYLV